MYIYIYIIKSGDGAFEVDGDVGGGGVEGGSEDTHSNSPTTKEFKYINIYIKYSYINMVNGGGAFEIDSDVGGGRGRLLDEVDATGTIGKDALGDRSALRHH